MKCIIIYFSQTGNTEKIAMAIQKGVEKAANHCDLVKIKDANPRRLYEYDLIGLGSPVFGVEPANIRAFVNNMRFVGGKHIFVFTTHGTLPILYFPSIYPRLRKRGLVVIGVNDWYGSCYLSHCPKPYPTDGHPDETDLKEAENFGKKMAENNRRIANGETDLIPPPPAPPPQMDKPEWIINKFKSMVRYHEALCTYPQCRLCMEHCPMDGIDLSLKPPVIAKPCIDCEFCVKICPTGALEAKDYDEYVTPLFYQDMHDTLLKTLNKAEADGQFRPLVAKEEIGWKTPVSKIVRNKHPQWIIGKGLQIK